jgi:uncharacterized membrane protein (DUF106 family)
MENSLKNIATNYGLYLGSLLAILTVAAYAINLQLLTNTWYGVFILIAIIVFGIISVAKAKQIQNGFISFKQAFTSYFITILIGLIISTIVSYVLFNFIDLEAAATLKEETIEKSIQMMESFNTPSDKMAEAIEQMESQNQYSILNILKGLAGYLVLFSIIGLIVAAAMKRSDPNAS